MGSERKREESGEICTQRGESEIKGHWDGDVHARSKQASVCVAFCMSCSSQKLLDMCVNGSGC